MNAQYSEDFFKVATSLKKFKRAEVKDENDQTLIESMYTDLLLNDQMYKICLSDNTTFLIGRKGTGKSTLILRLEHEYRKSKTHLPCYIDTKTVFESMQSEYGKVEYLKGKLPPSVFDKYIIERGFIQSVLKSIIQELEKNTEGFFKKIATTIFGSSKQNVLEKIKKLKNAVDDNAHLKTIELPLLADYQNKITGASEKENTQTRNFTGKLSPKITPKDAEISLQIDRSSVDVGRAKEVDSWERASSGIFLKIFQIKNFIESLREILSELGIKKLVIFLDDFSEVEESVLKTFVDTVLAPLNNWAEEYICFKIAAYPGRIYYGGIDKGKVDIVQLDFYNLYSKYYPTAVEEMSVNFTERLLNNRFANLSGTDIDEYFDTSNTKIGEYYELIFKISMNIPRVIGYILFFCHQTHVSQGKKINKRALESASETYYEQTIGDFFDQTANVLMSFDEKISILQQRELLNKIISKIKEIKKAISSDGGIDKVLMSDISNPYVSHFYFATELEKFLSTLELNFFITKYDEKVSKAGDKVAIYCLNYGLAYKESLRWGRPGGKDYSKYYVARIFDFTKEIEDFLRNSKKIVCTNDECSTIYEYEKLEFLEFCKMKCPECHSLVEIRATSESIKADLDRIDKAKLLPKLELQILYELKKRDEPALAKEIAEELDVSSKLIAKRAEKLDREKGLVHRDRSNFGSPLIAYSITDNARNMYFGEK